MEARQVEIKERIPASRKLQADVAASLLKDASKMIVARGKKVTEFKGGKADETAVAAMLGTTGNLRAPTTVVGDVLLVGFNESVFAEVFDNS